MTTLMTPEASLQVCLILSALSDVLEKCKPIPGAE